MELSLIPACNSPAFNSPRRVCVRNARDASKLLHPCNSSIEARNIHGRRKCLTFPSALPETAISVAVAATAVGAAATLLVRRIKSTETVVVPTRTCEDCGGSGVCPECKGEGFVLRRPSDEIAERARLNSKSLATRYTAGLPKKWSYCTRCTSSRSCKTCEGRGTLTL
ncbi:hypothetical protein MLD38_004043 [Melastoma candidum]|uniref:Uncharacterized protein n=1 Tax=Melastoma candidum TaxID=119954 RepID=A0ACB9S7N3_9MYRT|nr:hypothetical protein MLD38_004043 [Melastoma candidum]